METAEEFLGKNNPNYKYDLYEFNQVENLLIEFAQMHTKAALETAADCAKTEVTGVDYLWTGEDEIPVTEYGVYKDSILNAYPLSNIK